jgi:2-C-methyl-D-erythritol 2,4-cyclodiphosphate synthase
VSSALPAIRVGQGFDVHPFGGDGPLVLGGITIPDAPGLVGHSDADVIAHAAGDALLSAAGLGDLGTRFPASDERFRNASSIEMLRQIAALVAADGWTVANVSVVVAVEQPTLGPKTAAMADCLGETVGAPVTVTAKRGEGIGAVGRGEGIAAWAVALLVESQSAATT